MRHSRQHYAYLRDYKKHPPVYYTVRSVVRFVFWGALLAFALIAFLSAGESVFVPTPDCEIYAYPC